MKYNPEKHHRWAASRRSIRLQGYDYSKPGAYFVTIMAQNRKCLFGDVVNGEMDLNPAGNMVEKQWLNLPEKFDRIQLDEYIIMPNHFHGIVTIVGASLVDAQMDARLPVNDPNRVNQNRAGTNRAGTRPAPTATAAATLGDVIGAFKSITTHQYILGVREQKWPPFPGKLWQRNYYEHIVRNEKSLNRIRRYIINNPLKWDSDNENPKNTN